ncbi:hypothetical protein [Nocardia sp. NPDC005366]|uniref:hypothetical protein n=1 Tax=Nocardia sp. NPDC005366 TaxID=3156878 RepID=UPI0033AE8928
MGVGYILGRTRKMRFALMLAGAAATRGSAGVPQELLQRGTSLLGSSPELAKIAESVRGELLGAARAAAVSAASNRIDSLNARLLHQTDGNEARDEIDSPEPADDEYDESAEYGDEGAEDELGDEYADEEEPSEADSETDEIEDEDDEQAPEPARARPAARTRRPRASESRSRGSDTSTGSKSPNPTTPSRRRVRADVAEQAPVRRTRR